MKSKSLKDACDFAYGNNIKTIKQIICPSCTQSFYHVKNDETNPWEMYGLCLHTVCLCCGHIRNGGQDISFNQIEHDL